MKLLIVDDSAIMRRVMADYFRNLPGFDVVTARDGKDALDVIAEQDPDVVTLDINMPVMDGLTCLAHIMETSPRPVVMVSSLTERGALATFEALELGAVDFVAKPGGTVSLNMDQVFQELRQKVMAAATGKRAAAPASQPVRLARTPRPVVLPRSRPARLAHGNADVDLVLIGCSTGGPKALSPILQELPGSTDVPIVVAQHMPERFTGIFARRLADECAIGVVEVSVPMQLDPGVAYIAAGGRDILVSHSAGRLAVRPVTADHGFTWHPSVSRLVASAMETLSPDRMIGIMLTGMGDDGSTEMAALRKAGGRTIAESEETAAIFGMPQKLIEKDGASLVLPGNQIGRQLNTWLKRAREERKVSCR